MTTATTIEPNARILRIPADEQEETRGDGRSAEKSDNGLQLTDHDIQGRSGSPFIVVDTRSWILG